LSVSERVRKKLERQEKTYETSQLMKEKRSEEYKVFEEVFDRPTLITIYDLINKGKIDKIYGCVKSGKESKLYWGKDSDNKEIAIKIFLTVSSEFRKGMRAYIDGDPRFRNIRRNTRNLIYIWARKEYRNLSEAFKSKVRVPQPYVIQKNVLLMEFIGESGVCAPLLKEVNLSNPVKTYQRILFYIKRLYREAKLVHGDLSEYNIMIWKEEPVIFDVSQSVSIKHPNAEQFLCRDLENLNRYFKKMGSTVIKKEELLRRFRNGSVIR
jgi:RIO kinase 1